ncbi:MAG TPA: response regulator transcription factor [Actinomycetota bacterium]|nr:response regulator transcription factor [Actinomycetota bacterium]
MASRNPRAADEDAASRRKLGIVIVEPLGVVRAGIALLVGERPDMEVLAEAGSIDEAVEAVRRIRRSRVVVLVALGMNGSHDSFWLIRALRERLPQAAILACAANAEQVAISRALFVGADGYVDKRADPVEFLQAIRAAARGEMVLVGPPPEWVGQIADGIEQRREVESKLTDRELQVLVAAAEGLTAREIARRLGVAERTVTTHLGRIYGKLGVNSRVGAILTAARSGLVTVGAPQ